MSSLPIITDPYFYLVAVPAVLLLGISKSGFGAGFGSLAVPLMALAVTVPQAAAILMPVLLVMDLLGMAAFRRNVDRQLLKFLLPWGLVGVVVGTLLFRALDARLVAGIVGGFARSGKRHVRIAADGQPFGLGGAPVAIRIRERLDAVRGDPDAQTGAGGIAD